MARRDGGGANGTHARKKRGILPKFDTPLGSA